MKYLPLIIAIGSGLFLAVVIVHDYPYNTEQVCFDKDGKVVFYAQGFSPNSDQTPARKLTEGVYRIVATDQVIKADCRWSWGAGSPRGREYYE